MDNRHAEYHATYGHSQPPQQSNQEPQTGQGGYPVLAQPTPKYTIQADQLANFAAAQQSMDTDVPQHTPHTMGLHEPLHHHIANQPGPASLFDNPVPPPSSHPASGPVNVPPTYVPFAVKPLPNAIEKEIGNAEAAHKMAIHEAEHKIRTGPPDANDPNTFVEMTVRAAIVVLNTVHQLERRLINLLLPLWVTFINSFWMFEVQTGASFQATHDKLQIIQNNQVTILDDLKRDKPVTSRGMAQFKQNLSEDITGFKKAVAGKFFKLDKSLLELKNEMSEFKAEVKQDISEVKLDVAEVKRDVAEVKQDVSVFKAEVKSDMALMNQKLDILVSAFGKAGFIPIAQAQASA